mgnify:FL=1|jgi:hypothetical protein|nr:MAG TPA: tail protein [Caudoviricetes sp.]
MTKADYKEYALKAINKIYRNDPWVRELYQVAGLQLQDIDELLDVLLDNGFFDAVGDRGLRVYEKDLGITGDGTVEQRRAIVQMLWNNNGKCTLDKIKAIVKTFVLDDVDVKFEEGVLKLEFNNSSFVYAIPQIRSNLTTVKPSHIGLSINDVHSVDTDLYAGSIVTTFETTIINPMVGFNSMLEDASIVAGVYITKANVINRINC